MSFPVQRTSGRPSTPDLINAINWLAYQIGLLQANDTNIAASLAALAAANVAGAYVAPVVTIESCGTMSLPST